VISLACLTLLVLGQLVFQRQYFGSSYTDQKRADFDATVTSFAGGIDNRVLSSEDLMTRIQALDDDQQIFVAIAIGSNPKGGPSKPLMPGSGDSVQSQLAIDAAAVFLKQSPQAGPQTHEQDGFLVQARSITVNQEQSVLAAVTSIQPVSDAVAALDRTIPFVLVIVVLVCAALSLLVSRVVARPLVREIAAERQLNERQRAFIANASHELKTPISIISGFSEDLTDHPMSEEQRQEHAAIIYDEAQRMSQLVKSMLDSARAEQLVDPVWTDVSLPQFIVPMVAGFRALMDPKSISIDVDTDDLVVRTDESMLYVVVANFLSNASFHTPAGGTIWVTARRDGVVTIAVENEGDPIPDELLPRLWDSFFRAEAHRGREDGRYGLGLSIAQAYAHRIGATLGVENTWRGVKFTVSLVA